ncbi:MAG: hypothetical protein HZA31_09375 [Opitutae bacterium]|nr:hypothetical protein [Opitutae bacterium]
MKLHRSKDWLAGLRRFICGAGNCGGAVLAVVAIASTGLGAEESRLANLSTRAQVGVDAQVVIAGFVVGPGGDKQVLIRAAGPALTDYGLTGVLADPVLTVFDAAGVAVATNDNWRESDTAIMAGVGAFPFIQNSRDAAIVTTLSPGGYTAHVTGLNRTTGLALIEVYELTTTGSRLVNISTRAQVGTGAGVVIPGIVLSGSGVRKLLVRAVGPGLAALGLSGSLADPQLTLTNAVGTVVYASNDNWGAPVSGGYSAAALSSAFSAAGAFGLTPGSADAAVLVELAPGNYTIRVNGANDTSGLALVEVYDVTGAVIDVGDNSRTTILEEKFDNGAVGGLPTGWTLEDATGGTATVQARPGTANQGLCISDASATNSVIVSKWMTAPQGVLSVEFDACSAQTGAFIAAGYLLDAAGKRAVSVYFNHTTAEIQCYNGATPVIVQPYAADTWYRFKYVVNTFTSTYDVYVDGVLKQQNLAFREAAQAVSKIQFFSGAPAGTAYVDNVTVYTGGMLKRPTNLVFEDCNSLTSGSAPAGWSVENATGASAAVVDEPSTTNKSIRLHGVVAATPLLLNRPLSAAGALTVEFDLKPGQADAEIVAGGALSDAGAVAARVFFSATGEIKANNGSGTVTLMPYVAGQWYRIKYVLNAAAGLYDVYVDDRLQRRSLAFAQTVSAIGKIQFAAGGAAAGWALLDNVNISAEGALQNASYGAQGGAPTGDRTGGGEGYRRLVSTPATTVATAAALVEAVSKAPSGTVVYIADNADIDITSQTLPIVVPAGVTIASGRGKIIDGAVAKGGRVYGNVPGAKIFLVGGNQTRFTGFRLDGLDYAVGTEPYVPAVTTGISTLAYATTEVDNMEIKGFTYAGVEMNDGFVHHNAISFCRRTGLGYGIVQNTGAVGGAGIVIEGNLFNDNRHHIASAGHATNRYEARYNYSFNYIVGHAFDMHGHTSCTCAGDWVRIHHNTFADTSGSVLAILIREVPVTGAFIDNNWFYNTSCSASVRQSDTIAPAGDYGNMYVGTNKYGTGTGTLVTGCYNPK